MILIIRFVTHLKYLLKRSTRLNETNLRMSNYMMKSISVRNLEIKKTIEKIKLYILLNKYRIYYKEPFDF